MNQEQLQSDDVQVPAWILPSSLAFSFLAISFLFWLIYGNQGSDAYDVSFLAAVNASLNASSAICLFAGYMAIRRGKWQTHRNLMLAALVFSALFLVSYIIYHTFHGDSRFLGVGVVKVIYLFILASHIILSIFCLPLVLITVALSLTKRFTVHKKWARWTFPLWAYVSVTGVLIFVMLRVFGYE